MATSHLNRKVAPEIDRQKGATPLLFGLSREAPGHGTPRFSVTSPNFRLRRQISYIHTLNSTLQSRLVLSSAFLTFSATLSYSTPFL